MLVRRSARGLGSRLLRASSRTVADRDNDWFKPSGVDAAQANCQSDRSLQLTSVQIIKLMSCLQRCAVCKAAMREIKRHTQGFQLQHRLRHCKPGFRCASHNNGNGTRIWGQMRLNGHACSGASQVLTDAAHTECLTAWCSCGCCHDLFAVEILTPCGAFCHAVLAQLRQTSSPHVLCIICNELPLPRSLFSCLLSWLLHTTNAWHFAELIMHALRCHQAVKSCASHARVREPLAQHSNQNCRR